MPRVGGRAQPLGRRQGDASAPRRTRTARSSTASSRSSRGSRRHARAPRDRRRRRPDGAGADRGRARCSRSRARRGARCRRAAPRTGATPANVSAARPAFCVGADVDAARSPTATSSSISRGRRHARARGGLRSRRRRGGDRHDGLRRRSRKRALHAAGERIPLVVAPNMSIGVNVLLELVRFAAHSLAGFRRRDPRDASPPQGRRAVRHRAGARRGRRRGLRRAARRARAVRAQGVTGERKAGTIGFATLRGGDVVGEHTVIFAGAGERIELAHKATSRQNFASGALRAARFVAARRARKASPASTTCATCWV